MTSFVTVGRPAPRETRTVHRRAPQREYCGRSQSAREFGTRRRSARRTPPFVVHARRGLVQVTAGSGDELRKGPVALADPDHGPVDAVLLDSPVHQSQCRQPMLISPTTRLPIQARRPPAPYSTTPTNSCPGSRETRRILRGAEDGSADAGRRTRMRHCVLALGRRHVLQHDRVVV